MNAVTMTEMCEESGHGCDKVRSRGAQCFPMRSLVHGIAVVRTLEDASWPHHVGTPSHIPGLIWVLRTITSIARSSSSRGWSVRFASGGASGFYCDGNVSLVDLSAEWSANGPELDYAMDPKGRVAQLMAC
jgi:hypothetical protein